ncbi:hypothetical protein MOV08_41410 [Streptomyces yunnanensis]|uniref:Uncharacterized protein n=1 Tax=Streptomyces yunnanensis TaxID=156453 RepID=A0ABY8AJZ4_9ACTN|nr:hypothetical protein [Streptomyces yunnanensis]WEB45124.1 hypothetical protein MOV08_41410 [Streptomyces yunnanensis]
MKETVVAWWRRVRRRWTQASGLLLAFALVGLTTVCSRRPSKRKLRAQATAPAAQSRRAEEERKIRALIERLTAVEGLEHVFTRFTDCCARPYNGSIFENNPSPYALTCDMGAVAYFGVRGTSPTCCLGSAPPGSRTGGRRTASGGTRHTRSAP